MTVTARFLADVISMLGVIIIAAAFRLISVLK
jgi:hypothetical protein